MMDCRNESICYNYSFIVMCPQPHLVTHFLSFHPYIVSPKKVCYPDKIWLLRGNHECRTVSGHFGFKDECKVKYGVNVYYRFLLAFQTMPLAAVVTTSYGDIFACHGGLSPLWSTLADINKINRFVEPEDDQGLLDILWSDPVDEYDVEKMDDAEYQDFVKIDFRPNPSRGCSHRYVSVMFVCVCVVMYVCLCVYACVYFVCECICKCVCVYFLRQKI